MEITSDGKLPLMRIMELAYDVNCQVTIWMKIKGTYHRSELPLVKIDEVSLMKKRCHVLAYHLTKTIC
ncbi:hypothetical protein HanXRQr2_Chr13g0617531 [Helianthus annuus]|uniref:Uncharacterized protein n=1 Tax=Helianthus annuus TaxID=4232 RepID=A0A9K3EMW1_HELAN|nr:hypothetical protein HanXRQr2_Chr13g0617531 [Helianthus annuus]